MSKTFSPQNRPLEIRYKKDEKVLEVNFDNGEKFAIQAELLRVESPSAEVQGHGPGQKTLIGGRRHVGIMGIEPVGNYAVKIQFDDLHSTGIYTWDALYEFGKHQDELWQDYLKDLETNGLSRDP